MNQAITEAHEALLAQQRAYHWTITCLRAKNGEPVWQHYIFRRLNQVRPRYRRAARALHESLFFAGMTSVRPPPIYYITVYEGPTPPRPLYTEPAHTKGEAESMLRRLGAGRNEARRALNLARDFSQMSHWFFRFKPTAVRVIST